MPRLTYISRHWWRHSTRFNIGNVFEILIFEILQSNCILFEKKIYILTEKVQLKRFVTNIASNYDKTSFENLIFVPSIGIFHCCYVYFLFMTAFDICYSKSIIIENLTELNPCLYVQVYREVLSTSWTELRLCSWHFWTPTSVPRIWMTTNPTVQRPRPTYWPCVTMGPCTSWCQDRG